MQMEPAITIGLLECDHVRPELRHIGGDYREMFPALFNKVSPRILFRFYDIINGAFPGNAAECDGYLCTGSSFSVYDDTDWIHGLADFVRLIHLQDIPYAGVCFGHQMLGYALGGKVRKAAAGWCVGVHELTMLSRESWMEPYQDKLGLLMMCQDQVIDLPESAVRLASAADCPNAMMMIGRSMLGIQAHPEFPPSYDRALMELRKERIGEEKVARGIESLGRQTDEVTAARWIVNFFSNLQKRN